MAVAPKRILPLVALAVALAALAAAGAFFSDRLAHATDLEIEVRFREQREGLERLVALARKARLVGEFSAADEGDVGADGPRESRALMVRLGVDRLIRSADGRTSLQIGKRRSPGVFSGKGLMHSETPPFPLVEGPLDRSEPVLRAGEAFHRHLDGFWYLYLSSRQPATEG